MVIKYIVNLYYSIIFIADERLNTRELNIEKIFLLIKALIPFTAIAYLLNVVNLWFKDNVDFVSGFLVIVCLNALFGWWKHKKQKDFSIEKFLKKTCIMLTVVIVTYILLSIVASFGGENPIIHGFEIFLQVMTLLYPASKCLKSIHVISDGDYPPKFLMKRLYNYEENGDIKDLFKK